MIDVDSVVIVVGVVFLICLCRKEIRHWRKRR